MNKRYGLPKEFRIVDTTDHILTGDALFPFAYEELECRRIAQGAMPLVHIWRHQRAFILGLRDRKLPYALKAMNDLEQQGYAVAVRHSGGAAVPLDKGVINLSIILPKPQGVIDFKEDFHRMAQMIKASLQRYDSEVQVGEITGSYCPGEFDLSIRGQKFCGIAQRRQTQAFTIQAFIVVEGTGQQRAELANSFYNTATSGNPVQGLTLNYPAVQMNSMASLAELLHNPSTQTFVQSVKEAMCLDGSQITETSNYDPELMNETVQMISVLRNRYGE